MDLNETIVLTDEDGNRINYKVIDSTRIAGIDYILVSSRDEDEEEGVIFRMSEDGDDYVLARVEDPSEIDYISRVFSEQNEELDIR